MKKTFVDNSNFIEFVSEVVEKITHEKFGEGALVDVNEDEVRYTEEAQDFFNEKYDEVESMVNHILGVYSNNTELVSKPTNFKKYSDKHNREVIELSGGYTLVTAVLDIEGCLEEGKDVYRYGKFLGFYPNLDENNIEHYNFKQ